MKTSSAKAKGRRAAVEVQQAIIKAFGGLIKEHDCFVASSGQNGEDLIFSPKLRKLLPLSFEVKNRQTINIWDSIKQAVANCGSFTPIVAFKRNRTPMYVTLSLDDFLNLVITKKPSSQDHETALVEI